MKKVEKLLSLKGRAAAITGAAGGLGRIFSEALAELGSDLILIEHPNVDLAPIKEALVKEWGVNVTLYYCDLESNTERVQLIAEVLKNSNRLDILINNAAFVGTSDLPGWNVPLEDQSIETWRRVVEVNLISIFELSQGLLPILRKSPHASVINIGSIYGLYGPDWRIYAGTSMSNSAAYAASKGGLMQLTRWLATSIAPEIRVNAIAPGGIFRNQPKSFVTRYQSKTPLARMATEDDFIGALVYLASDLSEYVTGQTISVDGGWGIW